MFGVGWVTLHINGTRILTSVTTYTYSVFCVQDITVHYRRGVKGGLLRSDVTWGVVITDTSDTLAHSLQQILGYISMHNFSVKVTTFWAQFFPSKSA